MQRCSIQDWCWFRIRNKVLLTFTTQNQRTYRGGLVISLVGLDLDDGYGYGIAWHIPNVTQGPYEFQSLSRIKWIRDFVIWEWECDMYKFGIWGFDALRTPFTSHNPILYFGLCRLSVWSWSEVRSRAKSQSRSRLCISRICVFELRERLLFCCYLCGGPMTKTQKEDWLHIGCWDLVGALPFSLPRTSPFVIFSNSKTSSRATPLSSGRVNKGRKCWVFFILWWNFKWCLMRNIMRLLLRSWLGYAL